MMARRRQAGSTFVAVKHDAGALTMWTMPFASDAMGLSGCGVLEVTVWVVDVGLGRWHPG